MTENKALNAQTTVVENPIAVMQRYEYKYILNSDQTEYLVESLKGHMQVDRFGLTTISSLYYDTPDRRLIRTSIENPDFKEKIRLRSYGPATRTSPVFLELKRKAFGIVYKRRVQSTIPLVERFFDREGEICGGGQINNEIRSFRDQYDNLEPSCMIIYDRTAYYEPDGDLRLTIDGNPRYRVDRLALDEPSDGISFLPGGGSILEIKVQDAMPLWLAAILSAGRIYKSSFSKYGEAYRMQMTPAMAM